MFCPNCGTEIIEGSKFCSSCGAKIDDEKCLNCKHIPCANLFLKKDELDGGELYVLKECVINQKKIVPCQPIMPLYTCCRLWQVAYFALNNEIDKTKENETIEVLPLLFLIRQCFYDFKASAFLALSAHYRGAIQLLRPTVEMILAALYFEKKIQESSEEEKNKVCDEFYGWMAGENKLDFGNLIKRLKNQGAITDEDKKRLGKVWGQLSEYLHPHFQHTDIGKEKCSKCPATVRYDENRYFEWLDPFQNIIDFIIKEILCYYSTITETTDGKEALGYLKNLELLEKELGIPMIKSDYLKDRIARLPGIDELFEVEQ